MSQHPIVHIEITAKDREAAASSIPIFSGWKVEQLPEMNYATFEAEGGPGGGFNPVENNQPAPVMVYIDTDDIDATLKKSRNWAVRCSVRRMRSRYGPVSSSPIPPATPWLLASDDGAARRLTTDTG